MTERRTGSIGVYVDLRNYTLRQIGGVGVHVDLNINPPATPLLPLVRWNVPGAVFEITGSASPVHWQAAGKTFQTTLLDLPVVVWNGTALRFELPDSWEDLAYDGLASMSYLALEGLTYGG